ncbi:MAG TPA: hypothetical protein VGV12_13440 [Gemmatimonadales bacterium]|nr:hypothetical protein [Gemmatimonadales bacterium]
MKDFAWYLATSLTTLAGCPETASAPPPPPRCVLSVVTAVTLSAAADTAIDPATRRLSRSVPPLLRQWTGGPR